MTKSNNNSWRIITAVHYLNEKGVAGLDHTGEN